MATVKAHTAVPSKQPIHIDSNGNFSQDLSLFSVILHFLVFAGIGFAMYMLGRRVWQVSKFFSYLVKTKDTFTVKTGRIIDEAECRLMSLGIEKGCYRLKVTCPQEINGHRDTEQEFTIVAESALGKVVKDVWDSNLPPVSTSDLFKEPASEYLVTIRRLRPVTVFKNKVWLVLASMHIVPKRIVGRIIRSRPIVYVDLEYREKPAQRIVEEGKDWRERNNIRTENYQREMRQRDERERTAREERTRSFELQMLEAERLAQIQAHAQRAQALRRANQGYQNAATSAFNNMSEAALREVINQPVMGANSQRPGESQEEYRRRIFGELPSSLDERLGNDTEVRNGAMYCTSIKHARRSSVMMERKEGLSGNPYYKCPNCKKVVYHL